MKEKGQSLVELAIGITILIYLLAGAVEFGLIFFQYVQLRDAAQEGALYGSVCLPTCTESEILFRAKGASTSPIDLHRDPLLSAEVNFLNENGSPSVCEGDGIEVVMSYQHKVFMPFIPALLGGNLVTIPATVTDTVLTPVC